MNSDTSRGSTNRTHVLNLVLLMLIFGGSAWAWPDLPSRIPAHFDAGGQVTRWTEASLFSWFALPLVALGLVGLNYGIARLLPHRPAAFNFPQKKEFLALPPERQAPVIREMQNLLYGMSAPLLGLFGFLQWMTYRTALGTDTGQSMLVVLLVTVLMTPIVLVIWMPRIQRELQRQISADRVAG